MVDAVARRADDARRVRQQRRRVDDARDVEKASVSSSGGSAIHCQGAKLWLLEDGSGSDTKGEKKGGTRQFVFDGSLPPESGQEDVYRLCCDETDVVSAVVSGAG